MTDIGAIKGLGPTFDPGLKLKLPGKEDIMQDLNDPMQKSQMKAKVMIILPVPAS